MKATVLRLHANGGEAIKLLESIKFDIALLDWKMPKVTGLEVCKKIRVNNSNMPVILNNCAG